MIMFKKKRYNRKTKAWKALCVLLTLAVALQAAVLPVCAEETETDVSVTEPAVAVESVEMTGDLEETAADTGTDALETRPEAASPAEVTEETTAPAEVLEEVTAATEQSAGEETQTVHTQIPLYFQTDYPDTLYGSGTIESSGCSITSLAMVATYLTGHVYLPDELADYFGGYVGNNMERLEYASDMLQLPWRKAENWHVARQALWDGQVVIALMNSKSIFTDSQHFIVITGTTEDGKFLVNDPYKPNYDRWDLKNAFVNGFQDGDISCGYSGAWIYEKTAMPENPFIYEKPEEPYVEPRYPEIELTKEETQLLARMVWVEAQGEPFEGQQAIAEVVFNRMMADNFSDTLEGVVLAENQFRSTKFLKNAEPTQTQYEAIERALRGPYVLPIDVVFFAQYPVNENVWGEIGGHVFCHQW